MQRRIAPRQLIGSVLLLGGLVAVLVLTLLLVRGMTYRLTVGWAANLPDWTQTAFTATSEQGILLLLALFGAGALLARSRGKIHLARGIAAGVGVVLAYVASESIKALISQLRPCHNFDVTTLVACPASGDWSWPSNHATIAVAIAVAVLAMSVRLGLTALTLALLIGVSRVVVGVHYFHDVVAGAGLGATAVIICARWGTPFISQLLGRVQRRFPTAGRLLIGPGMRRSADTVHPPANPPLVLP